MNHSRFNKSRVKILHKRRLRLIYNDKTSSYKEVLEKDGLVSVHHKNFQTLAGEIFKIKNGMSPVIVFNIFLPWTGNPNNLRQP